MYPFKLAITLNQTANDLKEQSSRALNPPPPRKKNKNPRHCILQETRTRATKKWQQGTAWHKKIRFVTTEYFSSTGWKKKETFRANCPRLFDCSPRGRRSFQIHKAESPRQQNRLIEGTRGFRERGKTEASFDLSSLSWTVGLHTLYARRATARAGTRIYCLHLVQS